MSTISVEDFVHWIADQKLTSGQLYGWPDFIVDWQNARCGACVIRKEGDEHDVPC